MDRLRSQEVADCACTTLLDQISCDRFADHVRAWITSAVAVAIEAERQEEEREVERILHGVTGGSAPSGVICG